MLKYCKYAVLRDNHKTKTSQLIIKSISKYENLYKSTGFVHKKRWGFKKLIYLFYESKINL